MPALAAVLIQGLVVGHQRAQGVVSTPDQVAVPTLVQVVAFIQGLVAVPTLVPVVVFIQGLVAVPRLGLAVVAITDQVAVEQTNGIDHHLLVIELLF